MSRSRSARRPGVAGGAEGDRESVLVVGAGPAGLATAGALKLAGVASTVLERSDRVGSSWRARYDGLKLNTNRFLSRLPGLRFSGDEGMFPSREGVVAYLERYVHHHRLDVRFGIQVKRLERANDGWRLETGRGALECEHAVIAAGYDRVPVIPAWPGRDGFSGPLLHASEYRNPEPFRDRDVLVVGPGCTGTEIAYYLATGGAARVCLAVRSHPHIVLRSSRGVPADVTGVLAGRLSPRVVDPVARLLRRVNVGDLSDHGLRVPEEGVLTWFRRRGNAPTIIDREVVDAIRARKFEIVPAVERFDGAAVVLGDGSRVEPDAVIAATGYERGLERLVGHLGVLGEDGRPRLAPPRTDPSAPGLHFVGYVPALGGNLRQIRLQARRLARAMSR